MAKYKVTTAEGTFLVTTDDGPAANEIQPGQAVEGGYWSDVGSNAARELTDMAKAAPDILNTGLTVASLPSDAMRYPGQRLRGVPHEQTALGEGIETVKNVAKAGPGVVKEIGTDLANTVTSLFKSFREKPISTVGNATLLFGGAMTAAGKAAPKVAQAASQASTSMARRAAGFTKANLKGQNLEKANEAADWILRNKIMTPGVDTKTMIERVAQAKEDAFARMTKVFDEQNAGAKGALSPKAKPQLREQFLFNPNKAIDDLEDLRPKAKNGKVLKGGQYDAQNSEIDDAIATVKGHGSRPIPWDEANSIKTNVNANFDTTKSGAVNNLRKRIYGALNDSIESQMDESAKARGGNIDDFLAAKKDYANAKTAEKGLDNLQSSAEGNRKVSLTDWIASAGGFAGGGGTGAVGTFAAKRLLDRYGMTTGATAARKIAGGAKKVSGKIAPIAPISRRLLNVGGGATMLNNTAEVMRDPRYRTIVGELAELGRRR